MPQNPSRRKSTGNSISTYFKKKEDGASQEKEEEQKTSPGKTSDYESDPSRSNTPNEEDDKEGVKTEGTSEVPLVEVKREIKKDEDEEDDTDLDMFADIGEEEDDQEHIKAAVTSGLLSAGVKREEERIAEETARQERQEEAKRNQLLLKEQQELSKLERFKRLKSLLNKSKIYSELIMKKMKSHEAGLALKQKAVEERNKKRADKEADEPAKKGNKRGRKKVEEEEERGGESKRRKLNVAKDRSENQRKFEGREIPENQPLLLSGGIMRSYQLEGYEWMATLWEKGINGILADEMGLGKTIQTVALFCHLYEMGVPGPFLVVAPLSTVPNWVNEFKRFSPTVPVVLYHGNQQERFLLRKKLQEVATSKELDGKLMRNVIVTSYEIAMNDRAAFSSIMWRYIVVDEGHRLKNMNCRLIRELKQYQSANRLLLTGTPLQNNLSELWSLLNFLLPEIFDDLRVFESWFDAKDIHESKAEAARITAQEQQDSILSTLHQILTPFLLRRVKSDVDLEIPPKKEVLVYCPMTARQTELYRAIVEKTLEDLLEKEDDDGKEKKELPAKRKRNNIDYSVFLDEKEFQNDDRFEEHLQKIQEAAESFRRESNTGSAYVKELERLKSSKEKNFSVKSRMMDMRKCVNHPYLIEYPITDDGMFYDAGPDMVDICGKLQVLDQMVVKLTADGHKTLIFSQMTKMLDILGDYCSLKKWKFCRLDGSMNFIDRQDNIDKFNKDPDYQIFLLSTRAGGLGINLTAADTCIIYDSDWNPQQDLQAQDRCHRIGQTKPVMIYRLVTANTIDHKIVERAAAKRKLEKMVIHKSKFKAGVENVKSSLQSLSAQELLSLLDSQDYVGALTASDKYHGQVFSEEQMDLLLDRSDLAWENNKTEDTKPATASTGIKGVFQVVDVDDKKKDLGSVKDKE